MADHSETITDRTPALQRLVGAFVAHAPMFREAPARALAAFGAPWATEADEAIAALFPDDESLSGAVKGYARFAMELLRLQRRFERERVYVAKTYAEAERDVYQNAAYMTGQYLPGLLLSHYLWPHHHRQKLFFESTFGADLRRAGAVRAYDVGVGTGFFSRVALETAPELDLVGFDVSPSSQQFATRHVDAFGHGSRYRCELQDILARPPEPVSWLISVEVLEHLEDPLAFLRGLRAMLTPGGKAFITTALNAANADHIYLYRNVGEVLVQLQEAGFAVEQYFAAAAEKPREPGLPVAEVAAFIVT